MLAVVELGGNQFMVRVGEVIDVKKMDAEINSTINADALLISDEEGEETKI
jgi:ribosomal protein L21